MPDASLRFMKLWTGYYCRWNPRMRPQDSVKQRQSQLLSITDQFRSKVETLRKELESRRRPNNHQYNPNDSENGTGSNGTSEPNLMSRFESINI